MTQQMTQKEFFVFGWEEEREMITKLEFKQVLCGDSIHTYKDIKCTAAWHWLIRKYYALMKSVRNLLSIASKRQKHERTCEISLMHAAIMSQHNRQILLTQSEDLNISISSPSLHSFFPELVDCFSLFFVFLLLIFNIITSKNSYSRVKCAWDTRARQCIIFN